MARERMDIWQPRPAFTSLSVNWRLLAGHSFIVAFTKHADEYDCCPGAAHCTRIIAHDKIAIRLYRLDAGEYKIAKLDSDTGKIYTETFKLDKPAVGRYLYHGLLLVKDAKTDRLLEPDEVAEIIANYIEGEAIDELRVEGVGYAVIPKEPPIMSLYDTLKKYGSVYWGFHEFRSWVESRTEYAEVKVYGDIEEKCTSQSTKIDSCAMCLAFPVLKVKQTDGDKIVAESRYCAERKIRCAYRGYDCDWETECYIHRLVANKNGDIEGFMKKVTKEEAFPNSVVDKAL